MPTWVRDYINPLQSGRYETWCIANPTKSSCPNSGWEEISRWILNKYFRLHHSKIEMKVYWLSQELNYQIKKYIIDSWKCAKKKMFIWKYSSSILLLFPSSFKIGIGLYFKPLTILTTVLSPQPSPSLSQSHGCLEYS